MRPPAAIAMLFQPQSSVPRFLLLALLVVSPWIASGQQVMRPWNGHVAMANGDPIPKETRIESACGSDLNIVATPNPDGSFVISQPVFGEDCSIRAYLPGYISSRVPLETRIYGDSANLGTLILRPYRSDDKSVTATTALAPDAAKDEFEKGLDSIAKEDWKAAEEHLSKAVTHFDRHAEAWYELGRVYEHEKDLKSAENAYLSGLDADPQFLKPLLRLSAMALDRGDFNALLDYSDTLIRRNPFEYPTAYYFNGVAHLQLHQLPEAEDAAQRAIELDPEETNPRSHYLMGFVLANSGRLEEARDQFETYLKLSPNANDADVARGTLAQIEKDLAARK